MKITLSVLNRNYFLLALLALTITSCLDMRMLEDANVNAQLGRIVKGLVFIVWLAAALKLSLSGYHLYKPAWPIVLYAAFLFWSIFPTMMAAQSGLLFNILFLATPLVVLLSTYNTIRNFGAHKWYVWAFCIMAVLLVYQYTKVFSFMNIFGDDSHLISSYYILYMLPLVLLVKQKKWKIVAILIAMVVILSSLKRSGVVALVMGVMAYVVIDMYLSKKLTPKVIIGGLIVLALFTAIFIYYGSMGEQSLFDRFENIGNDNGSGRTLVWDVTSKMISKLDMGSLLVGNGYNTVVVNSPINLSAHNDFLEVTFDYGIIGLVFYVGALFCTIYYAIKMISGKSPYAPSMCMLIVIFLIQSLISHIVINYWVNIFMMSFAYMIGNFERDASTVGNIERDAT